MPHTASLFFTLTPEKVLLSKPPLPQHHSLAGTSHSLWTSFVCSKTRTRKDMAPLTCSGGTLDSPLCAWAPHCPSMSPLSGETGKPGISQHEVGSQSAPSCADGSEVCSAMLLLTCPYGCPTSIAPGFPFLGWSRNGGEQ